MVIGSAGSPEKVRHLTEDLGFDAAFSYRERKVSEALRELAPGGIDVYFDNVGGDHLEAAIGSLRLGGRIAVCGMISVYNDTEPAPGPRKVRAFTVVPSRAAGPSRPCSLSRPWTRPRSAMMAASSSVVHDITSASTW